MVGGAECTLIKFEDDIKLSGPGDSLHGRDAILRDLDRLERWVPATELTKFNKAEYEVLHLGQTNPQYQYRLEAELVKRNPAEKDLGILVDEKFGVSWEDMLLEGDKCGLKASQLGMDWR
ncbi:rna-directed dna polymerase from mobile element jockey-like [Pitangus sulphuratus]|nr:rna-directed dna polymerase from mobile element jockey-like [Pitangus sulphuratus]